MEFSNATDGIMNIKLHQPTGIKEIIELNRIEYNNNHRETRRHVLLEAHGPYDRCL